MGNMQAPTAAMYNASPQASIAAVSAAAADTPMYEGEIKSVSTRNDYGFIDCEALRGKYPDKKNPSGRAVYVDISSLPESHKCVGAKVKFSLTSTAKAILGQAYVFRYELSCSSPKTCSSGPVSPAVVIGKTLVYSGWLSIA